MGNDPLSSKSKDRRKKWFKMTISSNSLMNL